MDFAERIGKLAEQVANNKSYATSEENTKQYMVLPFIRALGYDDSDPGEVDREYTLDWGVKGKDRVDYAIKRDGKAIMLIECKKFGLALNRSRGSQLSRYFTADKDARIGILTDGDTYKFFSDLDSDNRMDETPFFQFNTQQFTNGQVNRLEKFTKPLFKLDDIVHEAKRAKAIEAVKEILTRELSSPSEEFANYIAGQVGEQTRQMLDISLVMDAVRKFALAQRTSLEGPMSISTQMTITDPIQKEVEITDEWVSLEDFVGGKGTRRPNTIRFPDGEERGISSWRILLIEVAEWLVRRGILSAEVCPILSKNKDLCWVNVGSKHPGGKDISDPHQLSNGLILRAYSGAFYVVRRCKQLANHCQVDASNILLRSIDS